VTFAYDKRGRLIGETRGGTGVPPVAYDLAYTYDQLGNRLSKTDNAGGQWTVYDYDVHQDWQPEDPYPTHHNRLLQYRVYDGDPNEPGTNLLRTVSYIYYKTGWASNITIKDEYVDPATTPGDPDDYDWARDLALYYYSHGDLRLALWGKYEVDPNGDPIEGTYETEHAREFDNDSPRARYLMIDYDTNGSDDPYDWTRTGPLHWTDYDGVLPYGDADLTEVPEDPNDPNGPQVYDILEITRYLGTAAHQTAATGDTQYHHADLIGSTNLTTDAGGTAVSPVSYSAFGEILGATGTPAGSAPEGYPRYQYAGRYGYESDLLTFVGVNPNLPPITIQHLGARWCQPDIGRFVQRDPIGIEGGLNVYVYVLNRPTVAVDPFGLFELESATANGIVWGIAGGITGGPLGGLAGMGAGFIGGGYEAGDLDRLIDALSLSMCTSRPPPFDDKGHKPGGGGTMISGPPKMRVQPPRTVIDPPDKPGFPWTEPNH